MERRMKKRRMKRRKEPRLLQNFQLTLLPKVKKLSAMARAPRKTKSALSATKPRILESRAQTKSKV